MFSFNVKLSPYIVMLFIVVFLSNFNLSFANAAEFVNTFDSKFIHYDRRFANKNSNRTQNGLGLIFAHEAKFFNNKLNIVAAGYAAQSWQTTGLQREDVFALKNNKVSDFSLLGEANVGFKLFDSLLIRVGRQKYDSLLLSSKYRALPSSFEGLTSAWSLTNETTITTAVFDRWSRRSSSEFEGFATNVSRPNAIDYVALIGLEHKNQKIDLDIEYLLAKDYLQKWGVTASTNKQISNKLKLGFELGLFGSHDAGELFVNGANDALDELTGSINQQREHDGFGMYFAVNIQFDNHKLDLTRTLINDPWLEDSFADDHGTTPFPSKTFGPELTNKNESVWLVEYEYQWQEFGLNGLRSKFSYATGKGAENSLSANLGQGEESWFLIDLRYKLPVVKGLSARLRYRDYQSTVIGEVAGISSDRAETRFTVDYQYTF